MNESLPIYLHDHLAGSNFAVSLLETWTEARDEDSLRLFAAELLREIEADRAELRQMIDRLGGEQPKFKEALGWIAEKVSRFKLGHSSGADLALFEGLEMLALGILGKVSLWDALAVVAKSDPRLKGIDFARLRERAKDQHARVEARRLDLARAVFTS